MVDRISNEILIGKEPDPSILSLQDGYEDKELKLMRELAALEKEYLAAVKKEALAELDAQKSDYVKATDEELDELAAGIVNTKYDNIAAKEENKFASALDKVEYDILNAGLDKSEREKKAALEQYNKEIALGEEIARKHLAASSIAELSQKELAQTAAYEKERIVESYRLKRENLENKAASLEKEYELALDNYEIARAAELEKKAAELRVKAEKEALAADNANRQIERKKEEYLSNFRNILAEAETLDAAQGYGGLKKDNYEKRYALAKEFYSGLDKETAEELINKNTTLSDLLGVYYTKLLQEIQRS